MAIGEKDRKSIIDILKRKTGFDWTSDENGVYCKVILNAVDRFEGERIFMDILKKNGIPKPQNVGSSIRGMKKGQAEVSVEYTLNSVLIELLKDTEPSSDKDAISTCLKNNAQVAAMLEKKTGFLWRSDVDGVYCRTLLKASDRYEGERILMDILKKNGIPIPQNVDSSIRGIEKGMAEVSAEFTAVSVLEALFKEATEEKTDTKGVALGIFAQSKKETQKGKQEEPSTEFGP
ncbi:hypothetical protein OQJ19_08515 [Fluoribacter gormanii]|uniref:Uncharacterized protein n=1 Tax=Fluoribacter gormanii TaxID=464 RepID=A0A377GN08_9GAMM|nr:hypothetical protein [Fluoribacter gormanii]KTD04806.1 hypothetical protein Lgor_0888 [Fluoribacter gormanii]MCW8445442.1 hypothetical protein [Fluoribacter gormanii]MCW8470694.1 hypothetical protein [Fluoribacter gormanii]SIR17832.1 hypothetical protein SAMN05421777_107125 [Fluoribacter gormanii]STO26191.1 Uncharacterised protein [Fluoribacter gormanii]